MSKKDLLSKSLENVIGQKEKNDEDIKRNIVIWEDFKSLIPALQTMNDAFLRKPSPK